MALKTRPDRKTKNLNALQPVMVFTPVMDPSYFARISGFTEDTVRGQVDRNNIPTVKIGRLRVINVAALTANCLNTQTEDTE
jgi:hypothetical protein